MGFLPLRSDYDTLDENIGVWLSAPGVFQNLNAALRKRQAGTGDWFLNGPQFSDWKKTANILLCIYGARKHLYIFINDPHLTTNLTAGCGKTVLWFVWFP